MALKQDSAINTTNSDLFQAYLSKHKNDVSEKDAQEFYHVNVVADAYSQGFSDGKKSAKKDFIAEILKKEIEKFTDKANQIYILSKRVISFIKEESYTVSALYKP